MMTQTEIENCPKCSYSVFSKCVQYKDLEKKTTDNEKRKFCLFCAMCGLQEALVRGIPAGAMMCFLVVEMILKEEKLL